MTDEQHRRDGPIRAHARTTYGHVSVAEERGFEPLNGYPLPVFKTGLILGGKRWERLSM